MPGFRLSRERHSILLATAQTYGATVWSQDADFELIAGVKYVAKTKS